MQVRRLQCCADYSETTEGQEHEAMQILSKLEPAKYESVMCILRGLVEPDRVDDGSEVLPVSSEEYKILQIFRGLKARDRETLPKMLDLLRK